MKVIEFKNKEGKTTEVITSVDSLKWEWQPPAPGGPAARSRARELTRRESILACALMEHLSLKRPTTQVFQSPFGELALLRHKDGEIEFSEGGDLHPDYCRGPLDGSHEAELARWIFALKECK